MAKAKRFLVSWAQNDTPTSPEFFKALKRCAQVRGAELRIVRGHYRNPTSPFEAFEEEGDAWAPELEPYLVDEKEQLCPNLCLFANIRTQPTAARPLSGLNVYVGENSAIIGHPKRALVTVANATRWPRILATTGACTVANYSRSTAGAKGQSHHVLGALVVEVEANGTYFLRQITWDSKTKSFTDLDAQYFADRVKVAPRALSLVAGDIHAGQHSPEAIAALDDQVARLKPQFVYLHDLLDCHTRSHHARDARTRYQRRAELVQDEIVLAQELAAERVRLAPDTEFRVVRSNHDEHLDRWLEEHDPQRDAANTPFWHRLWAGVYAEHARTGEWPNAFALCCTAPGVASAKALPLLRKIRFLKRNESCVHAGVEHGFHGHVGVGGSRGSDLGYAQLGVKVSKAHSHRPGITDGCYSAGHSALDYLGYNDLPCASARANIIQYHDGKRALVFSVNGKWHDTARKAPTAKKQKKAA